MISDYLSPIFHKAYRFSSGSEYGFLPFYVLITPFTKWYVLIEGNKFICWLLIINEKQQWWHSFIFLLACLRYILSRNSCISTSLELEQLYMNHVWGITHFMSNLCCFIESWRNGMILKLGDCVWRVETSSGMFPESVKGDWLRKSLLRLNLSSKSPPVVLEDKDVPETLGDGLGRVKTSQGMFAASLKMIGWQKAC